MVLTALGDFLRTLAGFFGFGLLWRGCLARGGLLAGLEAVAPLFTRLLELGFAVFLLLVLFTAIEISQPWTFNKNWGVAPNPIGKGQTHFPNPSHDFYYCGGLGEKPS
jgi:hypothetical protein